jgi:hypothetical protein
MISLLAALSTTLALASEREPLNPSSEITFWPDGWPRMASVFPDGISMGDFRIVHRTPTEQEALMTTMRALVHEGRGAVEAGQGLAILYQNNKLWMSDTQDERNDHRTILNKAHGQVLIGGLGLGMIALACALKSEVDHVLVIEINPDVIGLVVPWLHRALRMLGRDPSKIEAIQADLLTWIPQKGQKYDCVWFDIWENLCTYNLQQYTMLSRRYARRMNPGGFRGSWGEWLVRDQAKREARESKRSGWWRF